MCLDLGAPLRKVGVELRDGKSSLHAFKRNQSLADLLTFPTNLRLRRWVSVMAFYYIVTKDRLQMDPTFLQCGFFAE